MKTVDMAPLAFWSNTEGYIGITYACFPDIQLLFARVHRLLESRKQRGIISPNELPVKLYDP